MRVARNVPEVISTIMLNFVAAQGLSYLVHGPMQEPSHAQPASAPLPHAATLPLLWPGTTLHWGFALALLAAVIVSVYLNRTGAGFALRVVGANPDAARAAGLDVPRTQLAAMLWSGALCGLAGAVELSGVVGTLYENYAPGYGFAAVAVALLGRLNPYGVIASALFFGALAAGSGSMERTANVSANLSYVLQAGTLLVLLGFQWVRWERRGPVAVTEAELAAADTAGDV
jgi:simple sugar transport system permease protein